VIVEVEGGAQPEIVERAGGAQPVIVERAGGAQPVTVDRTGQPPAPQEDWTNEPPADEAIKAEISNDGWIAMLAATRNPSARQNKETNYALDL